MKQLRKTVEMQKKHEKWVKNDPKVPETEENAKRPIFVNFDRFRPFFIDFVLGPDRCTLEKGSEMQKKHEKWSKMGQKWPIPS